MEIRLGIVGLGTVGQGVLELLERQGAFYSKSLGLDFRITAVCARGEKALARVADPACFKTQDPLAVANHPEVDVFVELAGGEDAPKAWVEAALKSGKHVVTANKALLAKHGAELFPLAAARGRQLLFEAAVGGGIPIVRTLQESLIGNDIEGLACIINGTCNYILTQMAVNKESFADALADAQRLGYAEADPTFDIDGWDALHKVSLLASLAHGKYVDYRRLTAEGIRNVSALDIRMAEELGYEVKLLGVVERAPSGESAGRILAAVYPVLLERAHQLASVQGVLNAVYLKTSAAGPLLLTGAGAGKLPTASSVLSDLIVAARCDASSSAGANAFFSAGNAADLLSIDELETEFYLRLTAVDRPGVLSKVTGILGDHGISIRALSQKPEHDAENVPVIILTHTAKNLDVMRALAEIDALDIIRDRTRVLRFYK
ncbi:MAG: hom [Fibrobacteria bacterium]|jgi:homoserine dehydrogenase|nr:hom [Fibrobacteria bacterium]